MNQEKVRLYAVLLISVHANHDTDTLAGQLEALRTGEAPKRRAKQVDDDDDEDDSDDDDESDTDGSDNDTSETDTETEDEEDAKKK